jgi:hypothetical protein
VCVRNSIPSCSIPTLTAKWEGCSNMRSHLRKIWTWWEFEWPTRNLQPLFEWKLLQQASRRFVITDDRFKVSSPNSNRSSHFCRANAHGVPLFPRSVMHWRWRWSWWRYHWLFGWVATQRSWQHGIDHCHTVSRFSVQRDLKGSAVAWK